MGLQLADERFQRALKQVFLEVGSPEFTKIQAKPSPSLLFQTGLIDYSLDKGNKAGLINYTIWVDVKPGATQITGLNESEICRPAHFQVEVRSLENNASGMQDGVALPRFLYFVRDREVGNYFRIQPVSQNVFSLISPDKLTENDVYKQLSEWISLHAELSPKLRDQFMKRVSDQLPTPETGSSKIFQPFLAGLESLMHRKIF